MRNDFNPNDNSILDILKKHYDVEICDDPDYLFCGVLYKGYFNQGLYDKYILDSSKIRILINGENLIPDYNLVDYSVCQYPIDYIDRNLYFPCGIEAFTNRRTFFRELQDKGRDYSKEFLNTKEYFASFIASHDSEHNIRGDFFKALNARKRVESVGSYLNNMPNGETVDWLDGSKEAFLRKCKFSLCFEDAKEEGFVSDKIVKAFCADTVPIYYGSSNIKDIFNEKAFIDISDYPDFDSAIDKILEIASNDELYFDMLRQPIFNNPTYLQQKYAELESFLCHIIDQPIDKACRRSRCVAGETHEKFMKRAVESELGIKVWRPEGKVVKEYLRNTPKRIFRKK
ncbi:MAG: glycosyltransferase family 10 [Eubacteriales bacterium]|nr:glycosyltransferase family 10 [Eubacteriales bacterium]